VVYECNRSVSGIYFFFQKIWKIEAKRQLKAFNMLFCSKFYFSAKGVFGNEFKMSKIFTFALFALFWTECFSNMNMLPLTDPSFWCFFRLIATKIWRKTHDWPTEFQNKMKSSLFLVSRLFWKGSSMDSVDFWYQWKVLGLQAFW
jgi:hypothetical protein